MRVLVTGGAGFIGHHMVEHLLRETDHSIVILDKLDHSGNLNRLAEVLQQGQPEWRDRLTWVYHDLRAPISLTTSIKIGMVHAVFHLAAGSSVDRSIIDPREFVLDNVMGTCNLLEWAREYKQLKHFIYVSTDEVFGPANQGELFAEWDRYNSANPYAATKAGAEELCLAYANTYKIPISIFHLMNNFGERQHVEKFIPMVMRKVKHGEKVLIHADPTKSKSGSRFYLHARSASSAILFIHQQVINGTLETRQKYNVVGEREVSNLEIAQLIAGYMGLPLSYELVDFHSSRPGHDLRYGLNGEVLKTLGWVPTIGFEESLKKTVEWTLNHSQWLEG